MPKKIVDLIFIGDQFYLESGTMMSSIYTHPEGQRYDWGFVNTALRNGQEVRIRPATEDEMQPFIQKLAQLLKSKIPS